MSCERFREALSRHAAGADIDGAAGAHLAGCDACAARLDLQRQLLSEMDGELERLLSIEASPELVARVVSGSRGASRDGARGVRPGPGTSSSTATAGFDGTTGEHAIGGCRRPIPFGRAGNASRGSGQAGAHRDAAASRRRFDGRATGDREARPGARDRPAAGAAR